ncbi:MAG: hypothetical protein ABSF73_10205 [Terriglobia bacterium]
MQFKRSWIYYVIGAVVFVAVFGINKGYWLFMLMGFGLGYLLHNWIFEKYTDFVNAFFTDELRKRQIKRKELEQELERLKEGD